MNNEELILQMLTGLTNEVKELKYDMSDMKKTINNIDERTSRIETHLENVTDKNILF